MAGTLDEKDGRKLSGFRAVLPAVLPVSLPLDKWTHTGSWGFGPAERNDPIIRPSNLIWVMTMTHGCNDGGL